MKKIILLLSIPVTVLLINACNDETVTQPEPGSIYITSNPTGAQIWIDGVNKLKTTPDTVTNVDPGSHSVTLKLQYYSDYNTSVNVTAGQMSTIGPVNLVQNKGSLYITSNPAAAEIWIDGANTSLITPDTVLNINEGVRNVTLKFQDYKDTTFAVSITADQTSIVGPVAMVSNIYTTLYGPVRIYETFGTGPSEPSGLDLSSGMAYGVSSAQNSLVDIYYSTDGTGGQGFLVQSADLYPSLIRETDFFVASTTNLFDGEDSPLRSTGTWSNNMGDHETNYVFLYDHDGHYSKLKVVNWGGGVPGEPAWVEVQWYYNETQLDKRFK